ncbi:glucosamine-6-phosphate deaminase [Amycolatopsis ultiminotia]|uniref:Glucosamine-6-phosphate deaminase n=1 Tax=Amycolatopsis ultiminotia TaxID=543629 RepID=A0ABP6VZA9_9PSEU
MHAGRVLRAVLRAGRTARVMFAAAPSQSATLVAEDLDWASVEFFHMDEYIGLATHAPQGFANWLAENFVRYTPGAVFHRIDPAGAPEAEAARYEALLGSEPFDLVLLGLGINGHLAFNDPPDFADPRGVRVVMLDDTSRHQQVAEGHFETFDDVPETAVTVTIARLLNADVVIASIPGREKRTAVAQTLREPIGAMHPGTALRTHPNTTLYVDAEADPR